MSTKWLLKPVLLPEPLSESWLALSTFACRSRPWPTLVVVLRPANRDLQIQHHHHIGSYYHLVSELGRTIRLMRTMDTYHNDTEGEASPKRPHLTPLADIPQRLYSSKIPPPLDLKPATVRQPKKYIDKQITTFQKLKTGYQPPNSLCFC